MKQKAALILIILLASCSPAQTPTPTLTQVELANPASQYCEQQGNRMEIRTDASGGQSGVCILQNGSECDEWAYFRGECGAPETPAPGTSAEYQGWWTYTRPNDGFSIMLPADWLVDEVATSEPLLNGHVLYLHPASTADTQSIRLTFRKSGEDILLWPTGVGEGEFITQGSLDISGQLVKRIALVCPTGEISSIWYHQAEDQPNITRGGLEFGIIFRAAPLHCQPGASLQGKAQHTGELIISSLQVP